MQFMKPFRCVFSTVLNLLHYMYGVRKYSSSDRQQSILIGIDRSVTAAFSKPYWTGITLEVNNEGGAAFFGPKLLKWTAKV